MPRLATDNHDVVFDIPKIHNLDSTDANTDNTPNRRLYKPRKPMSPTAIAKSTACNRKQNRSKHPWRKQWGKSKTV